MDVKDVYGNELKPLDVVTLSTPDGVLRDRIKDIVQLGNGALVIVLSFDRDIHTMEGSTLERYVKDTNQSWK